LFKPATKPLVKLKAVVDPNPENEVVATGALPFKKIAPSLSVPKIPLMEAVAGFSPLS
jgi:hypothetical protein